MEAEGSVISVPRGPGMMLDIVCWKWKPRTAYRSQFGPDTVNTLMRMVARNLKMPHRFTCITDDASGIDSAVRVIPLWNTFAEIPSPAGPRNPSCYRRLRMFSPEARELIGERIVSMDLDTVITGDVTPLFDRDDDFIIWGGQGIQPRSPVPFCWYNGSLMMLKAGTRTKVWTEFNPSLSPALAHRANSRGSDQGWITHCLGTGEKIWTSKDGVYSYRNHVAVNKNTLPSDARIVAFHGAHDPWMPEVQRANPWIKEFYW
jgi:hypothetical protein